MVERRDDIAPDPTPIEDETKTTNLSRCKVSVQNSSPACMQCALPSLHFSPYRRRPLSADGTAYSTFSTTQRGGGSVAQRGGGASPDMFSWGLLGQKECTSQKAGHKNACEQIRHAFLFFFVLLSLLFSFAIEIAFILHHRHFCRLHIVVWVC